METLAPLYANVTLVLERAMGAGLLIGAWFARLRRYRLQAWCQSLIVLLNGSTIVLTMVPSVRTQVVPKRSLHLAKAHYALATAHAALGAVTEVAGLHIPRAAGTRVLPEAFRVAR